MTHPIRTLAGCAALAAGLWLVSAAATADTPQLPKSAYQKAAEADVKFLQTRLAELAKDPKPRPGFYKPAIGIALLLSAYGDALGDAKLKGDAIKVAEALDKKEFKGADALAKNLAVKPGTPGKGAALPKPFGDEDMLYYVMNPFRGGTVGGLNLENEIGALTKSKNPAPVDPSAVEILAARSAVINAYAFHHPNEKAKTNAANKKLWEKWSTEAVDLSKQLAEEAGKGRGADEKKIRTTLKNRD